MSQKLDKALSKPHYAFLQQNGKGFSSQHNVQILQAKIAYKGGIADLYVAQPTKVIDPETKKTLEPGVSLEQIESDLEKALRPNGLVALRADTAISMAVSNLQGIFGYTVIRQDDAVFVRPPYEEIDKHKSTPGYAEQVQILNV